MTTLEKLEDLIYNGFKETDRQFKETDRKFQETDRQFKETDRKFQETDRQFKETDRQFKETNLEIRKLSSEVGKISSSVSRFAENMVAPAVVRLFKDIDIPIAEYFQRLRSPFRRIEFDIIAINTDVVVVVSVKTTLNVEDVRFFKDERMPIFKEVFPRYQPMKVIGAVAGMSIVQEADVFAMRHGLYVLAQSGENMHMLNSVDFKPKTW